MTVCISTFRHKPRAPGFGCIMGLRVFLKLRGVTRSDGALSPPTAAREIIAAAAATSSCGVATRASIRLAAARNFYYNRHMDTISRRSEQPPRPPAAPRARQPRLVAGGSGRALGRLQGDHQQDRARGGQPDRRDPGAAGRRLRPTLAGLMLRAEGQGERLVARRRTAGLARSRDRLSAQAGVQPPRSSGRNHRGRNAGAAARDAAGLVLRPYPPGRLGAGRQPRHHRRRRAACARRRRLPRLRSAGRGRPLPTRPPRPASMSSRWPGADAMPEFEIAPLTASPRHPRGAERNADRDGRAAAARSASCIRWRRRRPTHSGGTRWRPPTAASGSCSAPSTARS